MTEKTNKLFDNKKTFVLFLALVVLQLLLMCHWYSQRVNLYVDELYSLQYAHYETDPKTTIVYLYKGEALGENNWADTDGLKNTMTVGAEESVLSCSFFEALRLFLKRKNYFFLLNLFNGIFASGKLSALPGFLLNMLLFPGIQLVLFATTKKLTGKDSAGLFGTAFYGFSCYMINQALYVRFYQWTVLLISLVILLHLIMWERENMKVSRFVLCELAALSLFYLAFKNSELICVFGAAFIGLFICALLFKKRKKQALVYSIPVIAGVVYFIIKEKKLISIILHPEQYVGGSSYAKDLVAKSILSLTWRSFAEQLLTVCVKVIRAMFLSPWVFIASAVLLACLILPAVLKKAGKELKNSLKNFGFLAVLAGTVVLYELFLAMANCTAARYSAFGVYAAVILLGCICYVVFETSPGRVCRILLCLWFVAYAVLPFASPSSISLLYLDDESALNEVKTHRNADVLVVKDEWHPVYDAVYNTGDGQRILSFDRTATEYEGPTDFSDELLIYSGNGKALEESMLYKEVLPSMGYQFRIIGRTHCATIYYGYKE